MSIGNRADTYRLEIDYHHMRSLYALTNRHESLEDKSDYLPRVRVNRSGLGVSIAAPHIPHAVPTQ